MRNHLLILLAFVIGVVNWQTNANQIVTSEVAAASVDAARVGRNSLRIAPYE